MKKRNIFITSLICVTLISVHIPLYAQETNAYEIISSAQGLSQGMVYDIVQDKEGFVWVGTKDGLNRYDGYGFKVFTNDPYNSKTLSSNSINKLFEDSKGRIWVGTENEGLNVYDKKSGDFFRILHRRNNDNWLSSNIIKIIEEMPDGRMMIATEDGKINIITLAINFLGKNVEPTVTTISLPNNTKVYGIGNDKNKNIWMGGMDGSVYRFDPIKNSFIKLPNGQLLNNGYFTKDQTVLINSNLYLYDGKEITPLFDTSKFTEGNIILKPNSALWDKHHRELSFYDVSAWAPNKTITWGLKLPTDKRTLYPFIFDKSGMIFTGTVGYGLRKYNEASDKFHAQFAAYSTYSIVPKTANDIFLGDVVYRWKRTTNNIIDENAFAKIPSVTQIDNFVIAKTGDFWLKSDDKGYFKYNPVSNKITPYPSIKNYEGMGSKQPIIEDSKNQIWFAGLGGAFMLLNTATEKITTLNINTNTAKRLTEFAISTAIYEDKNGAYWIGTLDGFAKVVLPNAENSEPQIKWFYNTNNTNSLNYNHVACFIDDPSNSNYLWIGTKGGGLNRLEKSTGNFSHITVKDGLPDNVIYGLLADDAGHIWGSTNKGLFCMTANKNEKKSWSFRNFTKADGLQDNEFNTNAYAKLPNGKLAFGGVNGLNIFDPKEILAESFTPQVFITNILVNNLPVVVNDKSGVLKNTIEQTETISLTYLQDILTLEFAALDFTSPAQNRYRYKLEGADKDWVEAGTNRNATYLHLPAGKYTFKVQGSNNHAVWSEHIAELKIVVLPPWWRTWWAYLFYILVLGFAVRAYFKFKVNKAKLQNQLNFEQQEAKRVKELDVVKTQLYTNITHEFRTPLTVILGMAQQVKSQPDEYFDNGMNMIIRNGENLLNLVNEMLDLSKLESGKMELHLVNGDVINFLRYIVESFQSLAESQKKQFHFLSDIDSLNAAYDGEKLRQIVANLLSNALKFTPEKGNVYITIAAIAKPGAAYTTLIIKVKDTGIGIPESQLEHIFERFYQLDNSHTRKAEGTGIGLALTKELAKLMDGAIEVKSPPIGANKGTEFTVSVQLKNALDADMENADAGVEKKYIQKITGSEKASIYIENTDNTQVQKQLILLVEDNADVVAYTASCLPEYRFAVGKDGKEGFEIGTEIIPDLIITDVMMPYVDGFELCRMLRADERTSHIPIIMLTAKADLESRLEGLERGADVYLEKPFHKDELLLRIKKLLELRKKLQQYYTKQITPNNGSENIGEEIIVQANIEMAEHEFVKKVREAVEAHMNDVNFSVEQLCKYIFMSHSQLHRKLDALTGYSPNKFIRIIRLNKAKELLRNPATSIASLALDCGYNDAGYFARVFKQEFGVTPQEWRVREKV